GLAPEEAANLLAALGPAAVVVTLGARGALLSDRQGTALVPPKTVEAVDATAAGDAFLGGLVASLAEGAQLRDAVSLGNSAGAAAAAVAGAQASLPRREDLSRVFGAD